MDPIFLQMYPDAIAQCVYSTFVCAYPNSWNNFDEAFKNELSLCITLWQVGTRPLPGLWMKWNLSLLEPQNLLKSVGKETETDRALPQKPPETDVDKSMDGEKKDEVPKHEFKRLSIDEVRKTLQGSNETLVPLVRHSHREHPEGGKIVPSASEEERIGLAREQFQALENRASPSHEPQQVASPQNMSQCKSNPILSSQNNSKSNMKKIIRPEIIIKPAASDGTNSKITIKANIQANLSKLTAPGFKSPIQSSENPKRAIQPCIRVPHPATKSSNEPSACRISKPAIQSSPRMDISSRTDVFPRPQTNTSARIAQISTSKQAAQQLPTQPPARPQSGSKRIIHIQKIRGGHKICPSPGTVIPSNTNNKSFKGLFPQRKAHLSSNPDSGCKTNGSQPKVSLSPADELISRAKAKTGLLKSTKPNSKIGQPRVWLKTVPKNSIASSQPPTKTNNLKTVDQRTLTAASKDKTHEQLMLQAKRRSPATAKDSVGNQQQSKGQSGKSQEEDSGTPQKNDVVKILSGMPNLQVTHKTPDIQKVASPATAPSKSYQQAYTELKHMAHAFKGQSMEEILSSIKGPEFEHVLFNFHGHSPLVKHYINNTRRTHINEKESIVGRTEIVDDQPEKAVCYKEILAESKRTSEKNHAMFQR